MTTTFEHDETAHQFRLVRGDDVVSMADYRPVDDGTTLVFHHTLTTPAYRGNGYAALLIGQALGDVRAHDKKVDATCWFVEEYLNLHPEHDDLRA